ncbi:MAG: M56 family metallopeptidase, partial [Phycisphaerales bacterium]
MKKMEALMIYTQPFFAWLLETTVIASVVICLILAAQKLLGRRLGPRWCHALWLVLLLRMVLPWVPPSPVSLFHLIPASIQRHQPSATAPAIVRAERSEPVGATEATKPRAISPSSPTEAAQQVATPKEEGVTEVNRPSTSVLPAIRRHLPWLWLAGAVVLGGYLLASSFALWRVVKREHPLIKEPILELFEACKAQMGVQTIVALVPNDRVRTAALFGFVRPRLLLPREMIETASSEELRYVFLHELAHLKRHDIYLGWLASLLQVLHWFNPFVWLAFHQMRADRELACDALVLTRTHSAESHQYGRTMVALLERFSRSRPLPAMAGILESQSQLKRRITMIAKFKTNSYRWSPLAVTLIAILSLLVLPNEKRVKARAASPVLSASQITLRKIWSGAGVDTCGTPSGDGRYLSYVDWKTGDL